jgi:hypothetical protein
MFGNNGFGLWRVFPLYRAGVEGMYTCGVAVTGLNVGGYDNE